MFDTIILDTLVFDNTFSWTRAKKVYFEGDVVSVDEGYVKSEIHDLVEAGDWETLEQKFETTHFWDVGHVGHYKHKVVFTCVSLFVANHSINSGQ